MSRCFREVCIEEGGASEARARRFMGRGPWVVALVALAVLLGQGSGSAQALERGTLRVFSPVQMQVFIDGNRMPAGVTPLELRDLIPGPHTVVARAEGFKESSFTASVMGGHVTRVELKPTPTSCRVMVGVTARDFQQRMVGQITYRVIYYTIVFDRPALRAQIQGALMQTPGLQGVVAAPADFTLAAEFNASMEKVSGTFTLVDGQGVIVASETRSVNMPMGYDDNMTPFAMKRAREIVDKTMPTLLEKITARLSAPAPPPVIVVE